MTSLEERRRQLHARVRRRAATSQGL